MLWEQMHLASRNGFWRCHGLYQWLYRRDRLEWSDDWERRY